MKTKKPPVTRDSLPEKIRDFSYYLQQLPGVVEVRRCDLTRTNKYQDGLSQTVQHYERTSRTLRVKARAGRNVAFINLKIRDGYREAIESAVTEYNC